MPAPEHIDGAKLEQDAVLDAQVCVIGSGAGGAVVARELAERGVDVVLLEEGAYLTREDYAPLTPLQATRLLYRDVGLTASRGNPPVLMPMGRCVGGTTVINLGTALRMAPEHLERWHGAGLSSLKWDELERLYRRVEEFMPIEPVAAEHIGPNTKLLIEGARKIGLPEGEVLGRNAPGCRASARCFLGCPTNAKRAVHLNYVPRALEKGARLVTRCRVERVDARADGAEVVASILGAQEKRRLRMTVRAKRVVVACGALLTPLLLSRSGIRHKMLGENLGVHPACRAIGLYDEPVRGSVGVPQAYHIPIAGERELFVETAWLPPALMAPALPGFGPLHHELMKRYDHLALSGFRIIEKKRGSVKTSFFGLPIVDYDLGAEDLASVLYGLKLASRMLFETGARRVFVPVHGLETLESIDQVAKLDDPRIRAQDLELSGYHVHGTARMGDDPATSIVGPDGRVHGAPAVYVADASLFPTSSRVNPQMTVMALATRIAEHIAG